MIWNSNATSVAVTSDQKILRHAVFAIPLHDVPMIENFVQLAKFDSVFPHLGIRPLTEFEVRNADLRHHRLPVCAGVSILCRETSRGRFLATKGRSRYTPLVPNRR